MLVLRWLAERVTYLLVVLLLSTATAAPRELKLCAIEWPPFTQLKQNRIDSGITVDVLREAFGRLQVPYRIQPMSWILCRKAVDSGEMDGLLDATVSESHLTERHSTSFYPLAVFVLDESSIKEFDWSLLRGKRVGMVRGYTYGPAIQRFHDWVRVDADSDAQLMVWLQYHRVDFVLTDTYAGPILATRAGVQVRPLQPLVEVVPLYLSFAESQSALAARYDKVVGDMIADGTLDAIYLRYLPYDYHEALKRWAAK
jgi:polar amino acid transport system substrate-binding protein